jgi:hypothetical protein
MPRELPDPTVLDAEANMLRQQAAALHKASRTAAHRQHEVAKTWDKTHGKELADEQRQAKDAQTLFANKTQEAKDYRALADRQEAAAKEAEDKGLISVAEEKREMAAWHREAANDIDADAKEAQMDALEHGGRADRLSAERDTIAYGSSRTLERVADRVDEKVRLLAEGAQKQREADAQRDRGDLEGAAESERAARYFIDKADQSTIDVSAIDPAALEETGVTADSLNPQSDRRVAAADMDEFATGTVAASPTTGTTDQADETDTSLEVGDEPVGGQAPLSPDTDALAIASTDASTEAQATAEVEPTADAYAYAETDTAPSTYDQGAVSVEPSSESYALASDDGEFADEPYEADTVS